MSAYKASCKEVLSDEVSEYFSKDEHKDDPVNLDDVDEWLYTGDEVCEVNS